MLLPAFRGEVSIPSSRVQCSGILLGLLDPRRWDHNCLGTSAINYLPTSPSNPEGRRPQEHGDGSLKFTTISLGLEKEYCACSVPDGVIGFFIDIKLPVALWHWGRFRLSQN